MSISEYVAAFTEKIKLVPYMVPTKLSKVNNFSSGLPMDFHLIVRLATNLKAVIWVARNVETQIRKKGLEKAKNGEKMKLEGS